MTQGSQDVGLPPGGTRDLTTLAAEAGVTRTGFYPKKNRDAPRIPCFAGRHLSAGKPHHSFALGFGGQDKAGPGPARYLSLQ